MRIGFVVDDVRTEEAGFTTDNITIVLARFLRQVEEDEQDSVEQEASLPESDTVVLTD